MGCAAPDPFGENITVASTSFCRNDHGRDRHVHGSDVQTLARGEVIHDALLDGIFILDVVVAARQGQADQHGKEASHALDYTCARCARWRGVWNWVHGDINVEGMRFFVFVPIYRAYMMRSVRRSVPVSEPRLWRNAWRHTMALEAAAAMPCVCLRRRTSNRRPAGRSLTVAAQPAAAQPVAAQPVAAQPAAAQPIGINFSTFKPRRSHDPTCVVTRSPGPGVSMKRVR